MTWCLFHYLSLHLVQVTADVAQLLGEQKVDAILCVAGGWAGGSCSSKGQISIFETWIICQLFSAAQHSLKISVIHFVVHSSFGEKKSSQTYIFKIRYFWVPKEFFYPSLLILLFSFLLRFIQKCRSDVEAECVDLHYLRPPGLLAPETRRTVDTGWCQSSPVRHRRWGAHLS